MQMASNLLAKASNLIATFGGVESNSDHGDQNQSIRLVGS